MTSHLYGWSNDGLQMWRHICTGCPSGMLTHKLLFTFTKCRTLLYLLWVWIAYEGWQSGTSFSAVQGIAFFFLKIKVFLPSQLFQLFHLSALQIIRKLTIPSWVRSSSSEVLAKVFGLNFWCTKVPLPIANTDWHVKNAIQIHLSQLYTMYANWLYCYHGAIFMSNNQSKNAICW